LLAAWVIAQENSPCAAFQKVQAGFKTRPFQSKLIAGAAFHRFCLANPHEMEGVFSWYTFGTPLVHLFIYIVFHGKLRLALVSAVWYTGTPVFTEIRLLFLWL
jgi:hypothetical protein